MPDHMVTVLWVIEFDTGRNIVARLVGNCFCSLSITRASTVVYGRYRVVWIESKVSLRSGNGICLSVAELVYL
jgi:hypothetical protein